ncbi:hypothetical protein CRV01_04840 [Arcobacter sp. CECT 8983]|uniref:hypothetical protein n=1 Tax=Arcobacter sp. CECT 8983 TaxID=2044508 RepID=UPI00100B56E0|nr:hypothetical protein [Arcobacter sp. CECT 8983]RXJ90490.1 hypothetical protein CRV01_04840 [Arcobacter sp. CECT 8983]
MQVIKKIQTYFFIILFFSACSINSLNNYSSKTKELSFYSNSKLIEKLSFNNPKQKYYLSMPCVSNSYTIEEKNSRYGKLFFEYIDLNSNCVWTGLASSFFETSLNYELKLNSFEVVENIDINNYTFKTYKINNESYLSVIYSYYTNTNMFLIDYNGKFYTKFLKELKPSYKSKYLDKKRFLGNYDKSLVRKNILENYFRYERIEL